MTYFKARLHIMVLHLLLHQAHATFTATMPYNVVPYHSPQLLQRPSYLLQLPVRDAPQLRRCLVHLGLHCHQVSQSSGRSLLHILPFGFFGNL